MHGLSGKRVCAVLARLVCALGVFMLFTPFIPVAQAQQHKPIHLVVPYAAGGPVDASARWLAEQVKDSLGTIVVDNRPGAGGNLGADLVAKAVPDGSVIGIAATATHAVNPWLFKSMPYNAARDFAPITQILRVPNVLVMNADTAKRLGIASMQDLLRYAHAHPGELNYGSGGNGSAGHLAGELFKTRAGIFALHIPYNGGNPAQLALLSGQVDFNIDNLASAAPNIHSGKLLPLAVTSPTRHAALPDVPAMAEFWPGFSIATWWGLVAPAGTPAAVVQQLNQAFTQALQTSAAQARFANWMAEPVPSTPQAFGKFMAAELTRYEAVVKASGARVD